MSGAPVVQPGWCPGCDPSNCEGCGPTPALVAWWKRHRDGSIEINESRTFLVEDALATGRRPLVFGDTAPDPVAQHDLLGRMALALEVVDSEWRKSDPGLRIDIATAIGNGGRPDPVVQGDLVAWDTGSRLVRSLDELQPSELPPREPKAPKATPLYRSPAPVAHGNHADLLREAAELFRFYEQSHRTRGPEHLAKAERNAEIAGRIEAALVATAPVAQPLTDAQLDALRQGESRLNFVTLREFRAIARAIEHAHGITGDQK